MDHIITLADSVVDDADTIKILSKIVQTNTGLIKTLFTIIFHSELTGTAGASVCM